MPFITHYADGREDYAVYLDELEGVNHVDMCGYIEAISCSARTKQGSAGRS